MLAFYTVYSTRVRLQLETPAVRRMHQGCIRRVQASAGAPLTAGGRSRRPKRPPYKSPGRERGECGSSIHAFCDSPSRWAQSAARRKQAAVGAVLGSFEGLSRVVVFVFVLDERPPEVVHRTRCIGKGAAVDLRLEGIEQRALVAREAKPAGARCGAANRKGQRRAMTSRRAQARRDGCAQNGRVRQWR